MRPTPRKCVLGRSPNRDEYLIVTPYDLKELNKIIPKLPLLPLLIWSTDYSRKQSCQGSWFPWCCSSLKSAGPEECIDEKVKILTHWLIFEWHFFRWFCPNKAELVNPFALRMAKTLWSFGHSECNWVNDALWHTSELMGSFVLTATTNG